MRKMHVAAAHARVCEGEDKDGSLPEEGLPPAACRLLPHKTA